MKKIKLFALAVCAMLSSNAFAAHNLTSGTSQTIGNVEYTVIEVYKTENAALGKINTVSAKANNFTATELVIPETVTFSVEGTDDDGAGVAISQECTFKVIQIENDAFKGNMKITSVSIPANVVTIGTSAFEGCESLSEVTLAANSQLTTIGIGAFAWTSITTLDLSNATANPGADAATPNDDGLLAFGTDGATYGPLTSDDHKTNAMIEEVILPATCIKIEEKAFTGCTALATVDLKAVKTIDANAFLNCAALTAATIGTAPKVAFAAGSGDAKGIAVAATAFSGCTALATVELGKLALATAIDATAFTGCTGLKTLKYNDIAIKQTSLPFVALTSIEKVYFQKYIALDAAIPTGSFDVQAEGSKLKNIYYDVDLPDEIANQPFATAAFSTAATPRNATLSCPDAFFVAAAGFNSVATVLDGVTIGASSDEIIGNKDKQLVKDANSSNYYYYYKAVGGARSIAKKQESGATVTVYSAYIDVVDHEANIYFQPLRVVGGKYVVGAGKVVIVKSNQIDGVVAENGGTSTMDATIADNLKMPGEAVSALTVKTGADYLNSGAKSLWFFNNPANGFGFTKYDATKQKGLSANAVYMICDDPAAAGRLNIVWLDEAGNTTAIQKIENKAQADDAIYNLAGQKVSASYKGVVIKNGKKFIQK